MTERSPNDTSDQVGRDDQVVSGDSGGETDTWQFDPEFRWGGEDGDEIGVDDREEPRRNRLPGSDLSRGVSEAVRGVYGTFRVGDQKAVLSGLLKGSVRFAWPLAVGLAVVAAVDQVDPRRQIEYSRLITEMPLPAAIGVGVLGVVVRAVSGGAPDWPSAGVVIRTTVLLALLVGVFALLGPTEVV